MSRLLHLCIHLVDLGLLILVVHSKQGVRMALLFFSILLFENFRVHCFEKRSKSESHHLFTIQRKLDSHKVYSSCVPL